MTKSNQLALHYCESHLNPATGFVEEEGRANIVTNFLYTLALRSSHQNERAEELTLRLLAYQRGGFPVFLHDFPTCYDSCIGAQLLPIFVHLGESVKKSARALFLWSLEEAQKRELPALPLAIIGAAGRALGYQEALSARPPTFEGESGLIAFMLIDSLSPVAERASIQKVLAATHYRGRYIGPKTVLPATCFGSYSAFIGAPLDPGKEALYSNLIRPYPVSPFSGGLFEGPSYLIHQSAEYAICLSQIGYPLRLFADGVIEINGFEGEVSYRLADHGATLELTLSQVVPNLERGGAYEIEMRFESYQPTVNGKRATLFNLGHEIQIGPFTLKLSLLKGEGRFTGHINPTLGKIALRTVGRSESCTLGLSWAYTTASN